MATTSLTLLDRLRRPDQVDAWERFVQLYAPILLHWAELQGFQGADAEDLSQTVLLKLIRLLPGYERKEGHSFRGWLFTICRNECRDFRIRRATRALQTTDGLGDIADESNPGDLDEAEYRKWLVHRTLELIRPDFSSDTWLAFTQFVLEGQPAAPVAKRLGITANAVYLARNRVLTRLRQELAGLLE
jgi:RNA polymerase sigma factor (sigma-70 family)